MTSSRMVSALAPAWLAGCAPRAALIAPAPADGPPPVVREFRGVWVAAVANIDWPSRPGLPVDSQKVELIRLLDRARELGLDAFILHVRPAGDALYRREALLHFDPSGLEASSLLEGDTNRDCSFIHHRIPSAPFEGMGELSIC